MVPHDQLLHGAHYRSDHTYPWLASMCDLVTDLDPRAEHVYRFAGVILPWEADQVDAGIALLQKGCGSSRTTGCCTTTSGSTTSSSRTTSTPRSRRCAAPMALPGAHPSLARLAAVLAQRQYGPETTLAFLQELADDVDNSEVRGVVEEHMREAQLSGRSRAAAGRRRDVQATHRAARRRRRCRRSSIQACFASIPADPFDKGYEIDPTTGAVRSASGRVPSALHDSRVRAARCARRVRSRAMTTLALLRSIDTLPVAEQWTRPRADVGAEPLLELCGLSKDYRHNWTMRRLRVLHELDLVVRRGEILGLIGPNGAGKTTTFKCLLGLLRPSAGRVLFRGPAAGRARARRHRLPARAAVLLRLPHGAGDAVALRASLRAARPPPRAPASPR